MKNLKDLKANNPKLVELGKKKMEIVKGGWCGWIDVNGEGNIEDAHYGCCIGGQCRYV